MQNKNNKKVVTNKKKSKKNTEPGFLTCTTLCLGEIINGLHIDLVVTRTGKKYDSFVAMNLNGETIAFYQLKNADALLWPIMNVLDYKLNSSNEDGN